MARNKTEIVEKKVEPTPVAPTEKKVRKAREPMSAKFTKASSLIMSAINNGDVNSDADVLALINKAFMSDANKERVQERIKKLEQKLEAMKKASSA